MKIQINIDPQNSTLVNLLLQLLDQPELWKAKQSNRLEGPHGIAIYWDMFPFPYFSLYVNHDNIENVGFFDRWKIKRAAKKTYAFLIRVQELATEKAQHEKLSRLLDQVNSSKNPQ